MSMKRILSIAAVLLFALCFCGCSEGSDKLTPTESFFVNDFADVITPENESQMLSKAVALNEKTTAQVAVVTVEDLNGQEISDFALQLGREWGVGSEESDNGIVILLSESDREIYIAVGYGLEGALPDSKTGRIIDVWGLEYLKQNDFSTGLLNISNAIINEVYVEYGLPTEAGYTTIDNLTDEYSLSESGGSVAVSWISMIVILILISLISRRRGGIFFFGSPFIGGFRNNNFRGGFGSGGSFGGFSGGGFSGGGFRGGGGSFGGGGAGRGF